MIQTRSLNYLLADGKPGHLKRIAKVDKVSNKANDSGINGSVNGSSNSLKVPSPSQRSLINGTEEIGISKVSDEVLLGLTKEVIDDGLIQQPEPEL
ncbi:hypothetical protein Tco_0045515 [Tanacetum coccineum]